MIDVVTKTVRNEGLLAMYQGLESTLWRHILWNAGYFGCIFQVRQLLPKAETKQGQMVTDITAGSTFVPPPWSALCPLLITLLSYRWNCWHHH